MGRLTGKVALVTGTGGDGMGRAAAMIFAREGATVIGCDLNAEGAAETVARVTAAGGTMHSLHPFALKTEDDAAALVAFAVEKAGGVDILYNNVVWIKPGFATELSLEDLEYSVMGCIAPGWMMAKHVRPQMAKRGGGSIINIASMVGTSAGTGLLANASFLFAYGIGKAGVVRMTEQLAIDLAPDGIRVNALIPGSILPVSRKFAGDDGDALNKKWLSGLLIKRLGVADDVANAALYFASDEASYVTGQNLTVDGGWTVSGGNGWPNGEIMAEMRDYSGNAAPSIPSQYLPR
jgi:meso-butanediol dehydrogenase / (S,S)-butanediol dehydrogenase / diacetyl reductase